MRVHRCVLPRTAAAHAAQTPDWQDPTMIAQNYERAYCTLIPYPD